MPANKQKNNTNRLVKMLCAAIRTSRVHPLARFVFIGIDEACVRRRPVERHELSQALRFGDVRSGRLPVDGILEVHAQLLVALAVPPRREAAGKGQDDDQSWRGKKRKRSGRIVRQEERRTFGSSVRATSLCSGDTHA